MKITDVSIDGFGVWSSLRLRELRDGLNVFYGPNEAGKTTLMRFIRGVLYGFRPGWIAAPPPAGRTFPTPRAQGHRPDHRGGWLGLELGGERYQVERRLGVGDPPAGRVRVVGWVPGPSPDDEPSRRILPEEYLGNLLQGVSEETFNRVFAVGLREFQELATLEDGEVAEHLYALTMGWEGRTLLDALAQVQSGRAALVAPGREGQREPDADPQADQRAPTGRIPALGAQLASLERELDELNKLPSYFAVLNEQREEADRLLAQLDERGRALAEEAERLQLLDRCSEPHRRLAAIDAELHALPAELDDFPADGLQRFAARRAELAAAERVHAKLVEEQQQIAEQAAACASDRDLARVAGSVRALAATRDWIALAADHAGRIQRTLLDRRTQLNAALERLGPGWSAERIARCDLSPATRERLLAASDAVRTKRSRRRRALATAQRTARTIAADQQHLEQSLRVEGVEQLDASLRDAREQLARLEQCRQRVAEVERLDQRLEALHAQHAALGARRVLPLWGRASLGGLVALAAALLVSSMFSGWDAAAPLGVLSLLVGGAGAMLAWLMRFHYESDVALRIAQLQRDIELADQEQAARRRELDQSLRQLPGCPAIQAGETAGARPALVDTKPVEQTGLHELPAARVAAPAHPPSEPPEPPPPPALAPDRAMTLADRIAEQRARVERLERLAALRDAIARREAVRRARDGRAEQRRIDLSEARAHWKQTLRALDLPGSLAPERAVEGWRELVLTADLARQVAELDADLAARRQLCERFVLQVCEVQQQLAGRPHATPAAANTPPNHPPLLRDGAAAPDLDALFATLEHWAERLEHDVVAHRRRRELRRSLRERRHEAYRANQRAGLHRRALRALFRAAGARDEEHFRRRAAQAERRRLLLLDREAARRDLDLAAGSPEAAETAVRALPALQRDELSARLAECRQRLHEVQAQARRTAEQRGRVAHEMELAAGNRRSTELRARRAALQEQLRRAARRAQVLSLTLALLERVRAEYERDCQPQTLHDASDYFHRLTCGRYPRVWTPLGGRALRVDDHRGTTLPVEALSRGTREQLFLAIRLALASGFAQRSASLPLVLDDVLVNFDQRRAEAAVEVLRDFAAAGHQVLLFTCHLHIVHLFESQGVEPHWLPSGAHLEDRPSALSEPA